MKAYVVRGGQEVEIKAREIVPGDIVRPQLLQCRRWCSDKLQMIIEEGQVVPADGNLICDYAAPEGFSEWQRIRDEDPDKTHEHEKGEDSDDDGEAKHHGNSVVACDQVSPSPNTYLVEGIANVLTERDHRRISCSWYVRGRAELRRNADVRIRQVHGRHPVLHYWLQARKGICSRHRVRSRILRWTHRIIGSGCQGSGPFQGHHEQYRYFSLGPCRVLDYRFLGWWAFSVVFTLRLPTTAPSTCSTMFLSSLSSASPLVYLLSLLPR